MVSGVSSQRAALGLLVLVALAGCGQSAASGDRDAGGSGGTSGSAGRGTGGATGGTPFGGASGSGGSAGQPAEPVQVNCPAPLPCPELVSLMGEAYKVPTKEEIICTLEALRDGTPGRYVVGTQFLSGGPNGTSASGSISLVHGARKVRMVSYNSSSGASASDCELYPPEHYDECIARLEADAGVGGANGVYDCSWQTNCVDGSRLCPSD